MTKPIRTVAVLGSGVMGGGIAAHLANAGIPVLLLDIVPPKLTDAERASVLVEQARLGLTAGRTKDARVAFGSVADGLVHSAHVPVLVFHPV